MMKAIRDIGYCIDELSFKNNSILEGKIIFINILENNTFELNIEDFIQEKAKDYLYNIKDSHSGNKSFPFLSLTKPEKSLGKIKKWLTNVKEDDIPKEDKELIDNLVYTIQKFSIPIISNINNEVKNFKENKENKYKKLFLSISIESKYLGSLDVFKNFFYKKNVDNLPVSICSLCGEKTGVTDKIGVFKFYTTDKPGFISGGFTDSWKNFPVCLNCKKYLQTSNNFIKNNLEFSFHGLKYLLIPKLLFEDYESLKDILNILTDSSKKVSIKNSAKKRITSDEKEIFSIIKELNNNVSFNLLFIERINSSEKILGLIEDVLPSRIQTILKAKEYVDNILLEEEEKNGFNFGCFRSFFYKTEKSKKKPDLNKSFLCIVNNVFLSKEIDTDFLFKHFMLSIKQELKGDGNNIYFKVNKAIKCLLFLYKLELLTTKEEKNMDNFKSTKIFSKPEYSIYDTNLKKALALIGVLVKKITNLQFLNLGNTPFLKKMKGYRLDKEDFLNLIPEIKNKADQYKTSFNLIFNEISYYLGKSLNDWEKYSSEEELNCYFVFGLTTNLYIEVFDEFYPKKGEK